MNRLRELLTRFRKDEHGAFIALFGVLAVVLVATAGATVDFTSVQNARTRAQIALDAAALALQPEVYKGTYTEAQARTRADALMINRIGDDKITAEVTSADASDDNTTLTLTATLTVPLHFVALVGISEMNMTLVSQTTRGSQDLEVAVALDVTGSMLTDDKIGALREAAGEMVDILVLDQQEPTYTKMALVPYSMGVNVGSYAAAARGAITGPKAVTNVSWLNTTSFNISAINKANPARVTTSVAHGLSTGDIVYITGITAGTAFTALNNRFYTITRDNSTRFFLNSTSTSSFSGSWSAGGTVRECLQPSCQLVVTSTAHGFANNDVVYLNSIGGTTALNGNMFTATSVATNSFVLSGTDARQTNWSGTYVYQAYTSGGEAYCTGYGCQYYRFQNPYSNWRVHQVSTCVSERVTSPYQYTDTAPGTAPVGLNYPSSGNGCIANQIVPLTSDKDVLHDLIDDLVAQGSTAGQIGLAWAWYLLAPNFASLWPTDSQPAAYNSANLIKVVVLMTDGSFNSVYCNGVISADSTSGSGSTSDHINCNATNGNPFDQAKDMCDAMKDDTGIIVYTVGFDISDQTDEKDMLEYCASDPQNFKLAENEADLIAAFQEIAQDIAQLRLSE